MLCRNTVTQRSSCTGALWVVDVLHDVVYAAITHDASSQSNVLALYDWGSRSKGRQWLPCNWRRTSSPSSASATDGGH